MRISNLLFCTLVAVIARELPQAANAVVPIPITDDEPNDVSVGETEEGINAETTYVSMANPDIITSYQFSSHLDSPEFNNDRFAHSEFAPTEENVAKTNSAVENGSALAFETHQFMANDRNNEHLNQDVSDRHRAIVEYPSSLLDEGGPPEAHPIASHPSESGDVIFTETVLPEVAAPTQALAASPSLSEPVEVEAIALLPPSPTLETAAFQHDEIEWSSTPLPLSLQDSSSNALSAQEVSAQESAIVKLVESGKTEETIDFMNTMALAESVDAAEPWHVSEESTRFQLSQLPLEPPVLHSPEVDEAIVEQLFDELEPSSNTTSYRSSPSVTISNPSGFGADNFTGFFGVGYQERTRFANEDDGGLVVGMGFGDARDNVGAQLSYTVASFGGSRDFGTGGFNAKLHKRLSDEWSVALGWEGFATTGFVDFEDSIYASASHIIRTRDRITQPFSRVALTAGVGNGRFRTEEDIFNDRDNIGVFGSAGVRLAEPVSAIVEWTGQDLAAGLSITPFKKIPIVLLPAVRDITGAGDGARFVMGAGISFKL